MFRINGLAYPISKRFGRECNTLYQEDGDKRFERRLALFEKKGTPCKIILKGFVKENGRIGIFSKNGFESKLNYLVQSGIGGEDPGGKHIEVMISTGMKFSNSTVFSKILRLKDFIEYKGDLCLYIAQFPMFKKLKLKDFHNIDSKRTRGQLMKLMRKKNAKNLKKILGKFTLPDFIMRDLDKLDVVNIWAGRKRTISKLHFDFYKNFLIVLEGKKTVYMFPPTSEAVSSHKMNFQIFHEGFLTKRKKDKRKARSKGVIKANRRVEAKRYLWENGMIKATIQEGEALFIPEGWYHFVISEKNTIGVNFWFESLFVQINRNEKKIRNFLTIKKLKENLRLLAEKSIENSGHSLTKFKPSRIKRSIVEFIMDKVLKFDDYFKEDIGIKRQLFLNYLLDQLEISDGKTNAKKFLFEEKFFEEEDKDNFDHTDKSKEMFYEFFGIYFGEKERIAAMGIKKGLLSLMVNSDVKSLLGA